MCSCLDPMAQDIPEQDIVMGELELPPQMDPKPKMAAVYDTSPPPLHQNPPILAESAEPGTFDMGRLLAVLAGRKNEMKNEINGIREGMEANTSRMEQTMREEMQCMGAGLQDGLDKLKIGNGELRRATEIRETCRVTEKVTQTLKEEVTVTETCTGETRRQVTEYTETREITREVVERLHGVKEDAHTHTHTCR